MHWLVEIALLNGAAAVLLALLVTVGVRAFRRPALVHVLWILVLLKLVTPALLRVPLEWHYGWALLSRDCELAGLSAESPAGAQDRGSVLTLLEDACDAEGFGQGLLPPGVRGDEPLATIPPFSHAAGRHLLLRITAVLRQQVPWGGVVLVLWLTGSAIWLGLAVRTIYRFERALPSARLAPRRVQSETRDIAARMGIRRPPDVWLVPGAVSPMLWAMGRRARILFPAELFERLQGDERQALLAHELAHFRRRDHWVRLLELVATSLYWWHPVVWWARHKIHEAEEDCCDAVVVELLPGAAPRYAKALVETVTFLSESRPVLPPVASGLGDVRCLKKRITMILRGPAPARLSGAGRVGVLVLGAALLPLLPAFTEPKAKAIGMLPLPVAGLNHRIETNLELARHEVEHANDQSLPQQAPMELRLSATALQPDGWFPEEVWATAHSPDGTRKVTAGTDGSVTLRDTKGDEPIVTLGSPQNSCVDFAPDGKTFATGSWDTTVKLWNAEAGRLDFTLSGHTQPVSSVAFSPDGHTLASGSWDGSVKLWHPATGRETATLSHSLPVNCVRFSPDGGTLVVGSGTWKTTDAGLVTVWDVVARVEGAKLACASGVGAVAFSPDGTKVFSGEWNGTVTSWDVATWGARGTFLVHKDAISAAAFSPLAPSQFVHRDEKPQTWWKRFVPALGNRSVFTPAATVGARRPTTSREASPLGVSARSEVRNVRP